MAAMEQRVTRLAPSPTGALHLGNARTFLVNYLLARTRGWRIVMRIEDLDGPRVKPGAAEDILTDLRWLGLEWDLRTADQSDRGHVYRAVRDKLVAMGHAYTCVCSRKDVAAAASAPHLEDGVIVYPGTCVGRWANAAEAAAHAGREPAYRVATNDAVIEFEDMLAGRQRIGLNETGGDFIIYQASGAAAYQLAVIVDDAAAGVTDIVRADDLLTSAARQSYLLGVLGLTPRPRYWHLPLVIGPDGRRLAKRHGNTRLSHYRHQGVTAHRLLGLLGWWCGILPERKPTDMGELLSDFAVENLPAEPIVLSDADAAYLSGSKA